MSRDREVTTDQVDGEGRRLRQDVVPELGDELLLVEVEADLEDPAQPLGNVGALVVGGAVDVDLVHAVGRLGDAAGKLAGRDLALAPQHEHGPAQTRDDGHLCRQQDDHDDPVLHHDEDDGGERLAAEEHRLHEGIADEAAERLDLVLHHGRQFGLLDLAEVRGRKAQDTIVEFVSQSAQHALAHAALLGVDRLLEETVNDDRAQEDETHDHQVLELVDLESVEEADDLAREDRGQVQFPDQERDGLAVLERVALNTVVDDRLGHGQRHEVENLGEDHQQQDHDLFRPAVPPDVGEKAAFHKSCVAAISSPL